MKSPDTYPLSARMLHQENRNLQAMLDQSNESLRYMMESQLQMQEMFARTLETLLAYSIEAIFFLDDEGWYVDANPAACALTGYSHTDLLQKTVCSLVPEALREDCILDWQAFDYSGRLAGEYTLMRRDGEYVDVEYRIAANVAPGIHIMFLHDITARKQAERALNEEKGWSAHLDEMLQCIGALHRDSAKGAFNALGIN